MSPASRHSWPWAVTGLFPSLIPSFVTTVLKLDNLALAGGVVAILLAPAAAVQTLAPRLDSLRAQTAGLLIMIPGVAVLLVADLARSLAALIVAAVLGGLGMGLAFMGSLGDVNEIAPDDRKGDIVASYYVVVYIGSAIPAIGVGAGGRRIRPAHRDPGLRLHRHRNLPRRTGRPDARGSRPPTGTAAFCRGLLVAERVDHRGTFRP